MMKSSLTKKRWVMVETKFDGWFHGWLVNYDREKGLLLGTVRQEHGQAAPRRRFAWADLNPLHPWHWTKEGKVPK